MHRQVLCVLAAIAVPLFSAACGGSPTPERELVTIARPAGSWQGSGDSTIGFVSESGRFRIHWETRREDPPRSGTFRLTVHSAVSGRPMQVVADHRGEGSGDADFADDPRIYNFMVESANVEWSFSVEAISVSYATEPAARP
jgi:hypothetical protein